MSPYFKTRINNAELVFLRKSKCRKFPVRCRFRCRVDVGQ